MKFFYITILSSLALNLASNSRAEENQIYVDATDTDTLLEKEGQKCTVYGLTKNSSKSASGTSYVNFSNADFYLVTFKSDLDEFEGGEPHERFDEKRIAAQGVISIYKNRPQIKLTDPKQVSILEEDEEFPPREPAKPEANEATPAKETLTEEKKTTEPEVPKRKPPVDSKQYFK